MKLCITSKKTGEKQYYPLNEQQYQVAIAFMSRAVTEKCQGLDLGLIVSVVAEESS